MDFGLTSLSDSSASLFGSDPYGINGGAPTVGLNTDGTVSPSPTALAPAPVDAGGGAPADYTPAVLDVFKIGVQAWQNNQAMQNLLDYKKYETTAAGTFPVGQPALFARTASGGIAPTTFLILIGIVAFALMTHHEG